MVRRLIGIALGVFLIGAQAARAQPDEGSLPLCTGSADAMAEDPLLKKAMKAAYPNRMDGRKDAPAKDAQPCIYPYQAMSYDSAVVLITLAQAPGEACHGCSARMSAVFLKRERNRLVPVAWHRDFGESGTWGDPGTITPVRWGSDDGIVVEGGGTFQGETTSVLQAYAFYDGRAHALGPKDGTFLSQSDCGSTENSRHCKDITGTWHVDASGRLLIAYRGHNADGSPIASNVAYQRKGDSLVLVSGTPLSF